MRDLAGVFSSVVGDLDAAIGRLSSMAQDGSPLRFDTQVTKGFNDLVTARNLFAAQFRLYAELEKTQHGGSR